ncbi:unnamed protein product, partial [Dovyalis caffra]
HGSSRRSEKMDLNLGDLKLSPIKGGQWVVRTKGGKVTEAQEKEDEEMNNEEGGKIKRESID